MGFNCLLSGFEGNNFTLQADKKFFIKLNKFYKASSFFLIKIFKDPNPCMIRSLILYQLCCKNNIKAFLVTGIAKKNGKLAGHSWLKIDGKPFNENNIFVNSFTVISEV
ncbi:MAG: lasso peptide biosynthesis B2 protein [Candidatus Humimicrobiaceae bacterium]